MTSPMPPCDCGGGWGQFYSGHLPGCPRVEYAAGLRERVEREDRHDREMAEMDHVQIRGRWVHADDAPSASDIAQDEYEYRRSGGWR